MLLINYFSVSPLEFGYFEKCLFLFFHAELKKIVRYVFLFMHNLSLLIVFFYIETGVEFYFIFFSDDKLEDLKTQKRKIVSGCLMWLINSSF